MILFSRWSQACGFWVEVLLVISVFFSVSAAFNPDFLLLSVTVVCFVCVCGKGVGGWVYVLHISIRVIVCIYLYANDYVLYLAVNKFNVSTLSVILSSNCVTCWFCPHSIPELLLLQCFLTDWTCRSTYIFVYVAA